MKKFRGSSNRYKYQNNDFGVKIDKCRKVLGKKIPDKCRRRNFPVSFKEGNNISTKRNYKRVPELALQNK